MPPRRSLTPDELLAQYPPHVVELANRLRAFILKTVPDAREVAYAGWRAIGYRHSEAGYLGGIFLAEDSVKVLFEHGHLLPDLLGILEGTTKQTRHVTLEPGDRIPEEALAALLVAAVEFGRQLKTVGVS